MDSSRLLSALLSQVLVAFTVELDNEFERCMLQAGHPGSRLSFVIWRNRMRFLAAGPVSVGGLSKLSPGPLTRVKLELGCLERWRFLSFHASEPSKQRREGWGSSRGIRADWVIHLTALGSKAIEIWPPALSLIETRWRQRFGQSAIGQITESLQIVTAQSTTELPVLLTEALLAFTAEFDSESAAPLALCASTVRVLGRQPVRAADIPRLTGSSPETSGLGWQLKPYVRVEHDPASARGTFLFLSPRGFKAQQQYQILAREIEQRWQSRFGLPVIAALRTSLESLFSHQEGRAIRQGLLPPPGVARAGGLSPALGRRTLGPAAEQRTRDLVAQTGQFLSSPSTALPHYPLWDMNRGFGP